MFRIAQEAITNARKHASAHNLWVECWTDPPAARLTIRDDGVGLKSGRDDSYGISGMKERASLLDASPNDSTATTSPPPARGGSPRSRSRSRSSSARTWA